MGIEQSILDFINSVYTTIGWPGVIGLMAIESACIPIPSEIIMPLAGWMLVGDANLSPWFNLAAGAFGAIGCVIGSVIAYWVGMRGGRPFLNRFGRYILINPDDLERADRWFARNGDWAIFTTRLLPVVRTFISFPAGIARMRFGRFLVYTFVGSFIWCAALSFAGYLLGEHWEQIRQVMRPFDPFIIGVIVVAIAYYVYRHVRHARRRSVGS